MTQENIDITKRKNHTIILYIALFIAPFVLWIFLAIFSIMTNFLIQPDPVGPCADSASSGLCIEGDFEEPIGNGVLNAFNIGKWLVGTVAIVIFMLTPLWIYKIVKINKTKITVDNNSVISKESNSPATLTEYINQARATGLSDDRITQLLVESGWNEELVRKAL